MALLTLTGIVTGRGQRVLVRGFALRLVAGEVVHLTGPNGTGKTTLLEMLCKTMCNYNICFTFFNFINFCIEFSSIF